MIFYISSIKHNTTYTDHIKHNRDTSLEKSMEEVSWFLTMCVNNPPIHQTTQNHNPGWHHSYYLPSLENLTLHKFAHNGQQITNQNQQYWKAWLLTFDAASEKLQEFYFSRFHEKEIVVVYMKKIYIFFNML